MLATTAQPIAAIAFPVANDPQPRIITASLRTKDLARTPVVGELIRSQTGKAVHKVVSVRTHRIAGAPATKTRLHLGLVRVPNGQLTPVDQVLPWPVKVQSAPGMFSSRSLAMKGLKVMSYDEVRQRQRDRCMALKEPEHLIPSVTCAEVIDEDGAVLRPRLSVRAQWPDPEDKNPNRPAKRISGMKRADPLETLMHRNSMITVEHLIAADEYRKAWEAGPGGARPGYERPEISAKNSGPSGGPTEMAVLKMRAWIWIEGRLAPPARAALEAVVLNREDVSAWAKRWGDDEGTDRRYAVGYLVGVLDQLVTLFKGKVKDALKKKDRISIALEG